MKNVSKNPFSFAIAIILFLVTIMLTAPREAAASALRADKPSNDFGTVTFHGFVKPDNPSLVWFEWGEDGKFDNVTRRMRVSGPQEVTYRVNGLNDGVAYAYRIHMLDIERLREEQSAPVRFTYRNPAARFHREPYKSIDRAVVVTKEAVEVYDRSARVMCVVDPVGAKNARMWFEWGETSALGRRTRVENVYRKDTFESVLAPLEPGVTYYYRCVGQNDYGITYGALRTVRTKPHDPDKGVGMEIVVQTHVRPLTVTPQSAVLSGVVLPSNKTVYTWFEWGTDKNDLVYRTPLQTVRGGYYHTVREEITGLRPGETYYYRLAAESDIEQVRGIIVSFTTPEDGSAPLGSIFREGKKHGSADTPVPELSGKEIDEYIDSGDIAYGNTLAKRLFSSSQIGGEAVSLYERLYKQDGSRRILDLFIGGKAVVWLVVYAVVAYLIISYIIRVRSRRDDRSAPNTDVSGGTDSDNHRDEVRETENFIKRHGVV